MPYVPHEVDASWNANNHCDCEEDKSGSGVNAQTAYEYMDLAYSGFAVATGAISLFIAVLSGYLVVAYTVGSNLTRLQVSVLNVTYSIWLLFIGSNGTMNLVRARAHIVESLELVQHGVPPAVYVVHVYVAIVLLLWLTSMWFMWSIRHAKEG
jgi:hypothetical protein